jgi:DHA1 family bicyclomycin/chloramphenicol resistance-like MFS transporter
MLTLSAFSCDILLPAMFAMARDLATPIERVQAVVPVFLASAAIGQLFFGPASDRFGRRPVLLVGLGFYIGGSVAAMVATSIEVLLAARVSQGLGAACGTVLGRAILRDTHSGAELARGSALALAIFAIGPLTAPLIGALLLQVGHWRAVFAALTVLGLLLVGATLLRYLETNRHPDPQALEPRRMAAAARRVMTHPQSRHFMILSCLMSLTIVMLISNAPRIAKTAFGIEGLDFALMFAWGGVGIIIGQLASHRLMKHFGVIATTRGAAVLLVAVAALLFVCVQMDALTLPLFAAYLLAFNMTFLVVMANSVSLVLEPHQEIAGLAAAVFGSLTQLTGALLALLLLPILDGSMHRWSLAQLLVLMVIGAGIWLYRPRSGVAAATT